MKTNGKNENTSLNFGQFKALLPYAGKANRPTAKWLRESGEEVIAETEDIIVFKNGYFICSRGNHSTVFGVHEVKFLDYGEDPASNGRRRIRISGAELDALPWEYVLKTMGEFRLEHNAEVRDEYHSAGNVDDEEAEAKLNAQGRPGVHRQPKVPYYDMVEDMLAEQEKERKLEILAAGLKTLTQNERQTLQLYYDDVPRTEAEVARIMTSRKKDGSKVSQQAVHKTIERALKKLKKFFKESGC